MAKLSGENQNWKHSPQKTEDTGTECQGREATAAPHETANRLNPAGVRLPDPEWNLRSTSVSSISIRRGTGPAFQVLSKVPCQQAAKRQIFIQVWPMNAKR